MEIPAPLMMNVEVILNAAMVPQDVQSASLLLLMTNHANQLAKMVVPVARVIVIVLMALLE